MRIVHIQLRAPYTDNWGYQENILPRCQVRIGDEVTIITTNKTHRNNGTIVEVDEGRYTLDDGVIVIRIKARKKFFSKSVGNIFGSYRFYEMLVELSPDIIFVHGLYTSIDSVKQLINYKKRNPKKCIILADTHAYGFEATSKKNFLRRMVRFWERKSLKKELSYVKRIYGVTPECVEYANRFYGIPDDMLELLPLGFDPAIVKYECLGEIRKNIREKYQYTNEDIVIVHGGKIIPRRKTEVAINVCKEIWKNNPHVKLVIFGDIADDMRAYIERLLNDNKSFATYLGHLNQQEYYELFVGSDIAFFPGAQSVLWQEAIGCGLPIAICNDLGLEYLDRGGNVIYFENDNIDEMIYKLTQVINDKEYLKMHDIAVSLGRDFFSYEEMAKRIDMNRE